MSIFSRFTPISAALLPNAEFDDVAIALRSFLPWNWYKWKQGDGISKFEDKFKEYFNVKYAFSFSSGRAGFYAILRSLDKRADDLKEPEIVIQAYTTIAIPLAVKRAGFKPVYADIKEDSYNIDLLQIEKKITSQTKAILVQHTFGIPTEMDKIMVLCKKHNLILIEDCAHSLGAEYGGKKIGTFGDAAFFSFGRDKIISSTSGGMVIVNNEKLADKIKKFQSGLSFPQNKWIFRQLMHLIIFWYCLPVYHFFNIGKAKIFLSQKLGLISRAYDEDEKKGSSSSYIGFKFPNILAVLALNQFKKVERFNNHRRKIADIYGKSFQNLASDKNVMIPSCSEKSKPVFLYYTIQVDCRDELLKFAAKNHIILGDWFPGALGPKGVDENKFGYKKGDCPIAEHVGLKSLNLPTNIKTSKKDAGKIIDKMTELIQKQPLTLKQYP